METYHKTDVMKEVEAYIIELGIWVYSYSTDFCVNAAHLLGLDYVTFGSIFFGGVINGVILALVFLNIYVSYKKSSGITKPLKSTIKK
jgi:hypothetical protein